MNENDVSVWVAGGIFVAPIDVKSLTVPGIFPLTKGGRPFEQGILQAESFRCAIKYATSQLKPFKNMSIYYNIHDNSDEFSRTLEVAADFSSFAFAGKGFAIGGQSSESVRDLSSILGFDFNTLISPGAPSLTLSSSNDYPFLLRTGLTDQLYVAAITQICKRMKWDFISTIYYGDIILSNTIDYLKKELSKERIVCVCGSCDNFAHNTLTNAKEFVKCIKDHNIRVIGLLALSELQIERYLTLFETLGLSGVVYIFLERPMSVLENPSLKKVVGGPKPVRERVEYLNKCLGEVPINSEEFPNVVREFFSTKFRCFMNGTYPLCPSEIEKRSTKVDCLCTGKEYITDYKYYSSLYTFDSTLIALYGWSQLLPDCEKVDCRNEAGKPMGREIAYPLFIEFMRESEVVGTTGILSFKNTSRSNLMISIEQFDENGNYKEIGIFDKAKKQIYIDKTRLVWTKMSSSGQILSLNIPISHVEPVNGINQISGQIFITAACLGIIACIYILTKIILNRTERPIRKSNLFYNVILLLGITFLYVTILLWSVPESTEVCIARRTILTLSCATSVSSVFGLQLV
ncbi:periplasmic binding protein-like I [Rozella allomycis CSF55]|uniref:Periplasmic binding protein-like I n=1 Tax=Rozella allomycis (strain CSF55) TaxID=988480 RepID=A0A075AUR5_ROZAC|nr:hypothetical protein O9G_005119 [Rozella allomycis CSF55]RKP16606.1 periplasmic binding protein-like I [Rozella allomycis CSF55]|eukprot:EPZ33998.1 hypothetical protein O9G_005119 [Rozella allomycis CSF55]